MVDVAGTSVGLIAQSVAAVRSLTCRNARPAAPLATEFVPSLDELVFLWMAIWVLAVPQVEPEPAEHVQR